MYTTKSTCPSTIFLHVRLTASPPVWPCPGYTHALLLDVETVWRKIWILTILARYEAKIANICNFWTFRPVIQIIKHLFKIQQKASLPNVTALFYIYGSLAKRAYCQILKRCFVHIVSRITGQNVQKLQILLFLPHT